jgi:hypothetical protein
LFLFNYIEKTDTEQSPESTKLDYIPNQQQANYANTTHLMNYRMQFGCNDLAAMKAQSQQTTTFAPNGLGLLFFF